MIFLELFWAFMKVGLFAFGGGYASLPLIEAEVIPKGWMTVTEFTDIITISQMTPGPIALNAATFVGAKTAGPLGGFVATLGCIFPALVIVTVLAYLYTKFKNLSIIEETLKTLRPAVVSLIAASAITLVNMALFGTQDITIENFDIVGVVLFAIALFVLLKFKVNPIYVMIGTGVVGSITYLIIENISV